MRANTTVASLQKALSGSAPAEGVARLLGAELTATSGPPTLVFTRSGETMHITLHSPRQAHYQVRPSGPVGYLHQPEALDGPWIHARRLHTLVHDFLNS